MGSDTTDDVNPNGETFPGPWSPTPGPCS